MPPQQRFQNETKGEKAYLFFSEVYRLQRPFRVFELQRASGYALGTIEHYITKKWWFLASQRGGYEVMKDFERHTKEQFLDDIRQKKQPPAKLQEPLKERRVVQMQPQLLLTDDLTFIFVLLLCMLWRMGTRKARVRLYGRWYPL